MQTKRLYRKAALDAIDGISCRLPRGAFYVFPKIELDHRWRDDREFVLDLLNSTGVLTVQGSGFGRQFGAGHFRIVYLPNETVLEEAMDKLESFISS